MPDSEEEEGLAQRHQGARKMPDSEEEEYLTQRRQGAKKMPDSEEEEYLTQRRQGAKKMLSRNRTKSDSSGNLQPVNRQPSTQTVYTKTA